MLRIAVFLTCIALSSATVAQVYRWQAPDGSIIFSDEPPPQGGAESIEFEPLQTYSPPTKPSSPVAATPAAPEAPQEKAKTPFVYLGFEIVQPSNDEGVRANSGEITVQLNVLPALNNEDGDQIAVLLDGKVVAGPSPTTNFTLTGVNRGTHTLSAQIQSKDGNVVLKSKPIKFHALRVIAKPLVSTPSR